MTVLTDTLDIAGRRLRSRVVLGPYETNLCVGRSIGTRHVDHYRRIAAGGVGLIVTEIASVHESDWPYERSPLADECGPGWRGVVDGCRSEVDPAGLAPLVVAGLGHAGLQGSSAFSQRETWGPSPVPDANTRELPKEMEAADIAAVVDGFAEASSRAMTAGLDGVEVNAGQHSLVRQFLSGLTNLRGDEWGPGEDGTGRTRFALAVLEAVRGAVGDGIVGLRLSCDELAPWAGVTPEAAAGLVDVFSPLVDYLVVVRGSIFSVDATRPDAHVPAGFNLDLVGQMREAAAGRCLIVAQGSIVDPGQAEWAVTDGRADLVEMTRAQIADPDLVAKTAGRVAGAVRPCLLCNQRCRVRDNRNPVLTCTVHPTAGHERIDPELPTGRGSGPLVVVGAGPAGLECARVAAAAGFTVTVVEQADAPMTAVRAWTAAAGRQPLAAIAGWLVGECERLGVTVETGRTVTADDLRGWREAGTPVVLATGSRPRPLDAYVVADDATVIRAEDLLAGLAPDPTDPDPTDPDPADPDPTDAFPSGPVLVWDPIGGPVAISVAETIAARRGADGPAVHLACPDVTAGTLLSLTGDLASASTRLLQAGVVIHRRAALVAVGDGSAELVDRFTDEHTVLDVDWVVDCGHRLPADALWHDSDRHHAVIGDAVAPRTVFEAVLEGRRAAVALAEGRTPGVVAHG